MVAGSWCEVVRADTDDLRTFVDRGEWYGSALRGVFDGVAAARSRAMAQLGGTGTPVARTARLDGGHDPLAELIAEAGLADAFVTEVADALATSTASGSEPGLVAADVVDAELADVGLDVLGPDRPMATDRELLAVWRARRELGDVLAELDADVPDHLRSQVVGLAVEEWLASIDGADPHRVAAVSHALLAEGLDLRAGLGNGADGPDGAVATMLVTQGVLLHPGDHGDLVDDLARRWVVTGDGGDSLALEVLVDALDLHQTNDDLNWYGVGAGSWHRANQPWVRYAALTLLVDGTIRDDGTIGQAGQRLVDDVLDRYPSIVELVDDTWHDLDPADRYHSTADGLACRVWPTEGVVAVLRRALAAPNHGLTWSEHRSALALDALDAELGGAATDREFERLMSDRLAAVDELAGGDAELVTIIDGAMARGLSATEALRLARFGSSTGATNDRVRRLRVVYRTTAWGDPVDPVDASGHDHGPANDVARSLAIELTVLQSIQDARYAEGRPQPEAPLTAVQVDLVRRYAEIGAWFHHSFAWGWPGGAEGAARYLTELGPDEIDRVLPTAPDGFAELLAELSRPENAIVWDLLAGAADNDTFLGPDGTFRPADGRRVASGDASALLVQLALLAAVGPHQGELDADGDGIVHEDEVARWLDVAAERADVPPALIDRVRLGADHGLGRDTFGWDEFAEIIGWIGLAAAVTATVVYTGGAAAPLWVKAGLVGLAAIEAVAWHRADEDWAAALAAAGGVADLAAAARLARRMVADGATPAEALTTLRTAGFDLDADAFIDREPIRGSVADANFAQHNVVRGSKEFSEDGIGVFTDLVGYPIRTVDDLVAAIRAGDVDPAEIVVDYVVLDGHQLILNTRTSTALRRAGVPQGHWMGRNRTGLVAFVDTRTGDEVLYDDLARGQLKRNGLPAEGSPTLGVDGA